MFREQIRKHYDHLSRSYRRVADFILSDYRTAAFMTAAALADAVDVDTTTVVRFAQRLGARGAGRRVPAPGGEPHERAFAHFMDGKLGRGAGELTMERLERALETGGVPSGASAHPTLEANTRTVSSDW